MESLVSSGQAMRSISATSDPIITLPRVEKDGSEVELVDITPAMASVLAPKDERELASTGTLHPGFSEMLIKLLPNFLVRRNNTLLPLDFVRH